MIAWCIILFHQCLSLLVLLPGGPYCSIHTSLYQLCKKYISYSKTTNQQSTVYYGKNPRMTFIGKLQKFLVFFYVCISTGIAHYLEICILCIFLLQQTDRSITNNPPHSIQDGLNIAFTYIKEEMLFRNHPKCTIDNDYPSFFLIISKA